MNIKGALGRMGIVLAVAAGLTGCWWWDSLWDNSVGEYPGCRGGGCGGGSGIGVVDPESVIRGSFVDERDGTTYETITLEMQTAKSGATYTAEEPEAVVRYTWMARNLNFEMADSSWCYNGSSDSCAKYGRLYAWNAAKSACSGMGGGWHLPSRAEWNSLIEAVGGARSDESVCCDRYWYDYAGTKLKSTSGWNDNGNGTDDYGFSALPGGNRVCHDKKCKRSAFNNVGSSGEWWSSFQDGLTALNRYMDYRNVVKENNNDQGIGYSVRCVSVVEE